MFETIDDSSLSSNDAVNIKTLVEEWDVNHIKNKHITIETGNLLHSILTENSSNLPSTPIYQPALDCLERMTVTERVHEQKTSDDSACNTTVPAITVAQAADLENGIDFGYSQKFFHIADGNLYSVFSPLQGRSYGGKPSFLRKQRCTVRESQGRGRKNLKRGLKFHNFLPSESITSEKEDKSVSGEGEIWKVHAECRLREEHGTKQIMVSNWSVLGGTPSDALIIDDDDDDDNTIIEEDNSLSSVQDVINTVQFTKNITDNEINLLESTEKNPNTTIKDNIKGTELKAIVDKLGMIPSIIKQANCDKLNIENDSSQVIENCNNQYKKTANRSSSPYDNSQRKRRKPSQIRKIIPYTEYLSMIEDNTVSLPLDLSYHTQIFNDSVENKIAEQKQINQFSSIVSNCPKNNIQKKSLQTSECQSSITNSHSVSSLNENMSITTKTDALLSSSTSVLTDSKNIILVNPNVQVNETAKLPPVAYVYPINLFVGSPIPSVNEPSTSHQNCKTTHNQTKRNQISNSKSPRTEKNNLALETINENHSSSIQDSVDSKGHEINETSKHVSKSRARSNQRTIIRKKLEDTFRQNGFLVKTKQVSDGEATFCKFRQLRKYTRYYLKSWQNHLPEEVHKLWKGFLPPKTAIPPSSGGKREDCKHITK